MPTWWIAKIFISRWKELICYKKMHLVLPLLLFYRLLDSLVVASSAGGHGFNPQSKHTLASFLQNKIRFSLCNPKILFQIWSEYNRMHHLASLFQINEFWHYEKQRLCYPLQFQNIAWYNKLLAQNIIPNSIIMYHLSFLFLIVSNLEHVLTCEIQLIFFFL